MRAHGFVGLLLEPKSSSGLELTPCNLAPSLNLVSFRHNFMGNGAQFWINFHAEICVEIGGISQRALSKLLCGSVESVRAGTRR